MTELFCVCIYSGGGQVKKHLKTILDTSQFLSDNIKDLIDDELGITTTHASANKSLKEDLQIDLSTTTYSSLLAFGNRRYIHITTQPINLHSKCQSDQPTKTAFDVLMSMSRKYTHLPKNRPETTAKDRLHNAVIKTMREMDVQFQASQVDNIGKTVVNTVTDVLWYLDPHHETLRTRAIAFPKRFQQLQGFYEWQSQHKKKPEMTAANLNEKIDSLASLLMLPWLMNSKFSLFKSDLSQLLTGMKKYSTFLSNNKKRSQEQRERSEPVRSKDDYWTFFVQEASVGMEDTKSTYVTLARELEAVNLYVPLSTVDFEPNERFERRQWFHQLKLPFPYGIYTYQHGNYLGNLTWIWRVEETKDEKHPDKNIDVNANLRKQIPVFSTRAMRRGLISQFAKATKMKPAIIRSLYRFISKDQSAPESASQAAVDERVLDFLLNSDDPELCYDLRSQNGRPADTKFDPFWSEMGKLLEEKSVVHERRQSDCGYMPFAMSVPDLVQQVKERLPPDSPVPSVSWVCLNFYPSNPYTAAAMNYTGKFHVKYKVQQRLLRAKHEDSGFAFHQFEMMKCMAVKFREHSAFIAVDDKAIIPVGEPNLPVSTGARSHHRCLAPASTTPMMALDHDYSVCGFVSSVLFQIQIPPNHHDSFYDGEVHVTVKDKVFQHSTPMRHATENIKILRDYMSADDVNLEKPILFLYSDGGPDHRTTYQSVQISAVATFIALDLDMYIAVRTAPCQSYNNPAERIMSLLNLALQHVSLSRSSMNDCMEVKMKHNLSLKRVRMVASKEKRFKTSLFEGFEGKNLLFMSMMLQQILP